MIFPRSWERLQQREAKRFASPPSFLIKQSLGTRKNHAVLMCDDKDRIKVDAHS